jgi:hypothetical protein
MLRGAAEALQRVVARLPVKGKRRTIRHRLPCRQLAYSGTGARATNHTARASAVSNAAFTRGRVKK